MSTSRLLKDRGWVDSTKLPRGPNGRALCRQCSSEVPKGKRSFCNDPCVRAWKERSDPGYQRNRVFERDRGICAVCGVDTEAIQRWRQAAFKIVNQMFWPPEDQQVRVFDQPGFVYRPGTDADLRFQEPLIHREQWGWIGNPDGFGWLEVRESIDRETRQQIVALLRATDRYAARAAHRMTLWDMDHILPVIEGGGECDLSNLRTMCLLCHRHETKELAGRRSKKAKQ